MHFSKVNTESSFVCVTDRRLWTVGKSVTGLDWIRGRGSRRLRVRRKLMCFFCESQDSEQLWAINYPTNLYLIKYKLVQIT